MLAFVLVVLSILLLAYYCFFGFYNVLYGFASLCKPRIKKVPHGNKKVAVVIVSFNEENVIVDTIEQCEKLTYPNKVIVVGDDSTDSRTHQLLLEVAERHQCHQSSDDPNKHVCESTSFVVFHRHSNEGYKAGNLKEIETYLKQNGFEYMYLLDADWWPQKDAIERALEIIEADPSIAFVQTKRRSYHDKMSFWEHCLALNEDGCYYVDLPGRQKMGDPILFTGCCTLFRLQHLYAAEGFRPGHLTEDIDLTNRLYLLGYKGVYAEHIVNEGEVPPHYPAFRKQQERWTIGSAHTLMDYFWPVITSDKLNFREKLVQLRQNAYFTTALAIEFSIVLAFIIALLSINPESLQIATLQYYFSYIALPYSVFIILALASNFIAPLVVIIKERSWHRLIYLPFTIWISWSMIHTYFVANLKGFLGIKQGWHRTPKGNRKKILHKKKVSFLFKLLNIITLLMLIVAYSIEWYNFGIVDPFALFWLPAMMVGVFLS